MGLREQISLGRVVRADSNLTTASVQSKSPRISRSSITWRPPRRSSAFARNKVETFERTRFVSVFRNVEDTENEGAVEHVDKRNQPSPSGVSKAHTLELPGGDSQCSVTRQ